MIHGLVIKLISIVAINKSFNIVQSLMPSSYIYLIEYKTKLQLSNGYGIHGGCHSRDGRGTSIWCCGKLLEVGRGVMLELE